MGSDQMGAEFTAMRGDFANFLQGTTKVFGNLGRQLATNAAENRLAAQRAEERQERRSRPRWGLPEPRRTGGWFLAFAPFCAVQHSIGLVHVVSATTLCGIFLFGHSRVFVLLPCPPYITSTTYSSKNVFVLGEEAF